MKYGLNQIGSGSGSYQPSLFEGAKPPKENDLLNAAVKAVQAKYPNAIVWKFHGGDYQRAGIPDLYIGIRGQSLWVEFKRPGADTTMLQYKKLEQLIGQSVWCGTAESKETLLKMIEQILNF